MAPSRLRVEYSENPITVDVPHPRFSWALESTERNAVQSKCARARARERAREKKRDAKWRFVLHIHAHCTRARYIRVCAVLTSRVCILYATTRLVQNPGVQGNCWRTALCARPAYRRVGFRGCGFQPDVECSVQRQRARQRQRLLLDCGVDQSSRYHQRARKGHLLDCAPSSRRRQQWWECRLAWRGVDLVPWQRFAQHVPYRV